MNITSRTIPSPKGDITIFRVENASGAWVELSTLGAGVVEAGVPDRDGRLVNVVPSYADAADYIADGPCLGKCPGRYANRIARGHLEVGDRTYSLTINNGPNALHGGPEGFQNRVWNARELEDGVEFTYRSADAEENYPGNLDVKATYRWSDDNVLTLRFEAETDADTVVNLTNHSYFNLDGADAGSILDHELKINAAGWLPTDDTLIPTGEIHPVQDTPMDFREWKSIGKDIEADFPALKYGKGYDNCWTLDGWKPGRMSESAVQLRSTASGRTLTVDSDQPGVQIYTGNWLAGSPLNKSGRSYNDYDGVAIEMQGFPDAPNRPQFPTQLLRRGEKYERTIRFAFNAE